MILKILLIVLLSILGFVLLLVLLVLFAPFRYRLAGDFHEDIVAAGKARWLFASVVLDFTKADGLKYKIKVFGIPIINSEKLKLKKDKKKKKKEAEELEEVISSGMDEVGEAAGKLEAAGKTETGEKPKAEAISGEQSTGENAASGEEAKSDEAEAWNKGEAQEDNEEEDLSVMPTDEEIKKSKKQLKKEAKKAKKAEKLAKKEAKKKAKEAGESKSAGDKINEIIDNLTEKKNKLIVKKSHIEQFLDKPYVKRTIEKGKKVLKKLFKQILPRKLDGNLRYGLSSPAQTGQVTGYLAMILPLYSGHIIMVPDFNEKVIEGNIKMKGRIHLGMFIIPAGLLFISKDCRKTRKLAKMI